MIGVDFLRARHRRSSVEVAVTMRKSILTALAFALLTACNASDLEDGADAACSELLPTATVSIGTPEWSVSTRIGQTQTLAATMTWGGRPVREECAAIVWSSSDPQTATVSPEGLVRARRPGSVTITAADPTDLRSDAIELSIQSGVPSDQPVNMYTTWTARRVQHTARQRVDGWRYRP